MNFATLCVLYALVGLVCALAIWRRNARTDMGVTANAARSALAVPLWPLWAPIVLSDPAPDARARKRPFAARIEGALREGVEVATGTALDAMLNARSSARIAEMVHRADDRRRELRALLARPEFCVQSAVERVRQAEQEGRPRGLATARLHLENVKRLHSMADHDEAVLHEIADLTEALRTQLLMARFAGSSGHGIGDIIGDLWTRVEALSEAMECGAAREAQVESEAAARGSGAEQRNGQHGLTPHPGSG